MKVLVVTTAALLVSLANAGPYGMGGMGGWGMGPMSGMGGMGAMDGMSGMGDMGDMADMGDMGCMDDMEDMGDMGDMGGMEEPATMDDEASMKLLESKLKPVMDECPDRPLVDPETKATLCMGRELTSKKVGPAEEECGDDKKCFLQAMKWTNEANLPRRKAIQRDLAKMPLSESMRAAEEKCFNSTRSINKKTVEAILGGDNEEFLHASCPFDAPMEQERDGELMRYGGWQYGGPWSWPPQGGPVQKPVPPPQPKVTREMVRAARGMAYMKCIRMAFDATCSKKANTALEYQPDQNSPQWEGAWNNDGPVPDKLDQVPAPAKVIFSSGLQLVRPGAKLFTTNVMDAPLVLYDNDPESLYTIMMEDVDLNGGRRFFHWMQANIPGNRIEEGTVVYDYMPTFTFKFLPGPNGTQILNPSQSFSHRVLILVYRQPKELVFDEGQSGCTLDIANARVAHDGVNLTHKYFEDKYALEGPIAGNYLRAPYGGEATNLLFCDISKCFGSPFPAPLIEWPNPKMSEHSELPRAKFDSSLSQSMLKQAN
eukprot:maker-scaffold903_size83255-snap-gene-0.12 protein:Tk01745 transcript:maker-scaffold903_size83255-snap-gene-0.12-mRNA-1 annotation:"phosphatidylethanolamine-binding protein homolog -like isoform x4"